MKKSTLEKRKLWQAYHRKRFRRVPWAKHLQNARSRCSWGSRKAKWFKYYGGRGIKCFLSMKQIVRLWMRDKAKAMECPSLDRKRADGHYEYANCRFIEMMENRKRARRA